jgi:hypothetical protein
MVVLERRAKRHKYLRLSFDGMGMSNNTTYMYETKADEQKCLSYTMRAFARDKSALSIMKFK